MPRQPRGKSASPTGLETAFKPAAAPLTTFSQESLRVRAAFLSLRGLVFLAAAVIVSAGIGMGGWWVWDTYFSSPEHRLQRVQKKFEEEVWSTSRTSQMASRWLQ